MNRLISVTDVCAFRFCPRSLYIKLVLGLREPPKPMMVLGSIRHRVFEEANRREEAVVKQVGSDMQWKQVADIFASEYDSVLSGSVSSFSAQLSRLGMYADEVVSQMKEAVNAQSAERASQVFDFASRNNLSGDDLWQKLTPKVISEMRLSSPKHRLKGVIDMIEVSGNAYVPVEIKTGKAPYKGVWPDHRLQLSSYMLMLSDHLKRNVSEGVVKYVAAGKESRVFLNPFMEYEVKAAVDDVFRLLEKDAIPAFCGKSFCTVCALGDDFEGNLVRQSY